MEGSEFHRDQFATLREEIKATKARLFWIGTMGVFGIPLLTHVSARGEFFGSLLVPYCVLVLILLFLSEQHSMMRAGRFIREQLESQFNTTAKWEAWVESRPQFRLVDRHFVACFTIVFFLYYFVTIGMAVDLILKNEREDRSGTGMYWYWLFAALLTYAIGAIWVAATMLHHWKSSVSTMNNDR